MTKKLFFLKVKKSGGSKETDELKRKLESKSLLELLGMLDDVGKQRAADALKSVDPQQSLGISHLGLDGYLRKAFELLERGFPHMVGSGMTPQERADLETLRTRAKNNVEISSAGKARLKELEELEKLEKEEELEDLKEEEELGKTTEYLGIKYAALNAELAADAVTDKINALKGVFGSLTHPIEETVKTLTDVRAVLDYRNAQYVSERDEMAKKAYESHVWSSNLTPTADYNQYTENEAAGPLAEIISSDSGKPITREQIENAPNILRYLGANVARSGQPHITDPLDYDVIEHNGKIYVTEVKGKSKGYPNLIGEPKRLAFKEIKKKIREKEKEDNREETPIVPIIMWPNVPQNPLTKSGKYYAHIPSYSYVKEPDWKSVPIWTRNKSEKTYNFTNAKEIKNPRHKAVAAAVEQATESKEPETQAVRLARMFNNMSSVDIRGPGKQQEYTNKYNEFLKSKGIKPLALRSVQGYVSKAVFPNYAVNMGLYDYFKIPLSAADTKLVTVEKEKKKK